MVFVTDTKQRVVSMVAGITMAKNAAKYALSLLSLLEFGVLVVGISFDLNHVIKNTRHDSEQLKVRINEDSKRICNRTTNYFQN